jgi:ABC-type branched-subunit amino acid transport system substrate-binding protein
MRARMFGALLALAVTAAACGNSESSQPATTTAPGGGGSVTTVNPADLQKHVPVDAPGVTDTEIRVAVITATTNILQGRYGEFADGIQAYFDYVNSQGGIYGRRLKIVAHRDDKMFQNQQVVKASLAQDKAFATFIATPVFTAATDLAAKRQPTFTWNINAESTGHDNIFGTVGALCVGCIGQIPPFLAKSQGFTKVAVLAYGVNAASKQCGQGYIDSFKRYPSAEVVYQDLNLQFAQADLSAQVSEMKQRGAQFVLTCMDQKETLVLGKEIDKQQANIVQSLPNAYDADFIRENADVLEGSFVQTQFVPFEKEPPLPEHALIKDWVGKLGKTIRELTVEGWVAALQFVHGLKLAGPEFSQAKVIASLNRETAFSANGLKVPIDWTRQHEQPKGNPENSGPHECATMLKIEGGRFVPVLDEPGKPWVCMVGGSQGRAPTLTETPEYESFAPAG